MTTDYKSTLFLPQTDFPMRAGLPKLEPTILEHWERIDLFQRQRDQSRGREKFILHDGPPYANGNIHIGTALNKILKDIVNRSQQMLGKDANYVPGWDCHGLPIEWQIEERYRKAGKDKDEVPIDEFRKECRAFAEGWIEVQTGEFKRLGVIGDWQAPYTTMTYEAEAQIVAECLKFLMNGALYRGSKPVMWSVVEKTALAEAEVEYHDHTSTTIFVRFPVVASPDERLTEASVLIWTTTPWTMPGNRAICYGPRLDYKLIVVDEVDEGSLARAGEQLVVAESLREEICQEAGITHHRVLGDVSHGDLARTLCAHPWRGRGYEFDVPLFPGDHVTDDTGTGFVHTAPGHGAEDFEVGTAHGLEVPHTVNADGVFCDHVPLFAGQHVFKADANVVEELKAADRLLAHGKLRHSYPHSWRSKAPLIFRNTPQWFISMSATGLRDAALAGIDQVRWVPAAGRNRIHAMIAERPDWVVSRQRAWGVPLTLFVDKQTGEPMRDETINQRIVEAVRQEGADAWFNSEPGRFLGDGLNPDDYEKVEDILDVWFDSGSTHSFVLEQRPDLQWPASLYLEGSDQHRGWFHSSLLESCGTRGRPPYEAVLTHGFTQDEDGRKMSKSLGNVTAPQEVCDQYGADILRLWVVSSDYALDQRIGPEIIKAQVDAYRRLRNTLRFLLGNLDGFEDGERLAAAEMPELDRWVLHRLSELDELVRQCVDDFDFHRMYVALGNFCTNDLSAFYLDIRKDALYCDGRMTTRRRAARTVLDQLFSCLTAWLAPILCFTAEEAWRRRFPEDDSVHLRLFPEVPAEWRDDGLAARWAKVRTLRRVVTGALEIERKEKRIGASLQAHPVINAPVEYLSALDGQDLAEICITSDATLAEGTTPEGAFTVEDVAGIGVVVGMADGEKCTRCWQVLPEVPAADGICGRCAEAVAARDAA
ncbi:MAG: isoleucine--tRNA ligase [Alphaproteobacteria bacterium]|jgi:isoleucyl-tRNA synthetase|nr:isoleucine--tRNA ligase [Alphaproteobacteria bacterium]MDP6812920.1 isoleucine--tRNA ligase [Alphaproteobacteria bacterium]